MAVRMNTAGGGLNEEVLTARTSDVLSNQVFYGVGSDEPQVGTMPVQGGGTVSPQSYNQTIVNANRYVNGDIVLMGDGNFVESNIKNGVTMWGKTGNYKGLGNAPQNAVLPNYTFSTASLSNAVGTMPVQGGGTVSPQSYTQTVVNANRYVNGDIVLMGDGNFVESNIKKGVTMFGKVGTFEGYSADHTIMLYNYGVFHPLMAGRFVQNPSNNDAYWYLNYNSNDIGFAGFGIQTLDYIDLTEYNRLTIYGRVTYSDGTITLKVVNYDFPIHISSFSTSIAVSRDNDFELTLDISYVNNRYNIDISSSDKKTRSLLYYVKLEK